jgi:hypothetical protein
MVQMRFEMNASPKIRLREAIESGSIDFMRKVIAPEVTKTATKITSAATAGRPSRVIRGTRRRVLEVARRMESVESEGRTNRCR